MSVYGSHPSSIPASCKYALYQCSKWAKIARTKGVNDAAKSQMYSKTSTAIAASVRQGGADPTFNLRLASLIEKAKQSNVPKDVVERAIAAGSDTSGIEEIVLEGMGPGGVAVLIETLTSNRKRTTIGIRHIFKDFDCDIGSAVAFMFESRGRLIVPCSKEKQDEMLELAMAINAEDCTFYDEDSIAYIWTDPATVHSARKALTEQHNIVPTTTDVVRFPKVEVHLPEELDETFASFISQLEEHEDVQNVYHNAAG